MNKQEKPKQRTGVGRITNKDWWEIHTQNIKMANMDQFNFLFNKLLNEALHGPNKIKKLDSNNISKYVTQWIEENKIHDKFGIQEGGFSVSYNEDFILNNFRELYKEEFGSLSEVKASGYGMVGLLYEVFNK